MKEFKSLNIIFENIIININQVNKSQNIIINNIKKFITKKPKIKKNNIKIFYTITNNPIKKNKKKRYDKYLVKKHADNINEKSSIRKEMLSNKKMLINNNNKIDVNISNEYEINMLSYKNALFKDKRTYFEYYISLLKRKQLLIFTFYTNNDYNLRTIKISLFFFSLALNYTVNTLFFDDDSMHEIYKDKGDYNILFRITNILYSSIISEIISGFLEYLALTEDIIIEMKKTITTSNKKKTAITKPITNEDNQVKKTKKYIKLKFILFYIFDFLFLLFFWYYISCFCVVYKNTQIYVIKDTLFSLGMTLLFPIGLCLFPGIFRIPALRAKGRNLLCLYKISQFIENTNLLF